MEETTIPSSKFFVIFFVIVLGIILIAAGQKSDERLNDAQTQLTAEIVVHAGHSGEVSSVIFSSDGRWLISAGDNTVKLWNIQTGEIIRQLKGIRGWVNEVAFSPNGELLATASGDGVRLWDLATAQEIKRFKAQRDYAQAVAFSTDGKLLAGSSEGVEKTVKIWDVETGQSIKTLTGHTDAVHSVAFSPDNKMLATASSDKTIKLWNVETWQEIRTLIKHSDGIWSVAFSPDGRILASGGQDGRIVLWNPADGQIIDTLAKYLISEVNSVVFSPDGRTLAAGVDDKTIKIWDVKTRKKIAILRGHRDTVASVAFSPDGKTLVSGSEDKQIKLWDIIAEREIKTFASNTDDRWSLDYSPARKLIAIGDDSGSVKIWNIENQETVRVLGSHSDYVMSVKFSPDGRKLVSAGGKTIKIWDTVTGQHNRTFREYFSDVNIAVFSPDGKILASNADNGTIKLWDVQTGEKSKNLVKDVGTVYSLSFSPDGETLSGFVNEKTKFWNVRTGEEIKYDLLPDWARFSSTRISSKANIHLTHQFGEINFVNYDKKDETIATLFALDGGDWVVVTPDGRFDTNKSLDAVEGIHWTVSDDPLKPVPLEILMRDYYEPRLLSRLLKCNEEKSCNNEFSDLPNIADLNRVQPEVNITNVSVPDADRKVEVTVEAAPGFAGKDCRMKRCETDVFDLRLFRDGQLVGSFPDDSQEKIIKQDSNALSDISERKKIWREAAKLSLDEKNARKVLTFSVQLPKSKNVSEVDFTAYAFNEDRVKSGTARWIYSNQEKAKLPKAEKVNRRAFIVSVGVNASENKNWQLQFAARDASETQRVLTEKLKALGEYDVLNIPLISDYDAQNNLAPNNAAKKKIEAVFALLAGKKPDDDQKRLLDEIKQNVPDIVRLLQMSPNPDDLLIISFSSHGYADRRGNFYLLPYDVGIEAKEMKDTIDSAISSDDLSLWLKDVNAGDVALIIDACYAAASVENREFKPAPMGSRGLGQLAYDKNIKVLTATKADDVALEAGGKLKQGLLSYALLREGLEKSLADFKLKDGKVYLKEWLEYGEDRVPTLYEDIKNNNLKDAKAVVLKGSEKIVLNELDKYQQKPSLFDFSRKNNNVLISVMKK